MTTRNAIFAALRTRLEDELTITTWFDRPKPIDQISPEQHPAAFLMQEDAETATHGNAGSVWSLRTSLWLHVRDTSEAGPVPAMRDLIEDVEDALAKKPQERAPHARTTLGGLVYDVRILGVGGDLSNWLETSVVQVDLEIIVPVTG